MACRWNIAFLSTVVGLVALLTLVAIDQYLFAGACMCELVTFALGVIRLGLRWARRQRILQTVSYNTVMKACVCAGDVAQAGACFARIADDGVQADVITYSAAVSACEKGGQCQRALELFHAMRASGE